MHNVWNEYCEHSNLCSCMNIPSSSFFSFYWLLVRSKTKNQTMTHCHHTQLRWCFFSPWNVVNCTLLLCQLIRNMQQGKQPCQHDPYYTSNLFHHPQSESKWTYWPSRYKEPVNKTSCCPLLLIKYRGLIENQQRIDENTLPHRRLKESNLILLVVAGESTRQAAFTPCLQGNVLIALVRVDTAVLKYWFLTHLVSSPSKRYWYWNIHHVNIVQDITDCWQTGTFSKEEWR